MNYYTRVLITIILIGIVICLAFLWDYIADKFKLHKVKTNAGKRIIILVTMLVELTAIWSISIIYKFPFVDTLFVSCFLIMILAWNSSYFGNYSSNNQQVINI